MKKVIAAIMCVVMLVSMVVTASASTANNTLKFNDDGKFTVVHLTDIQDGYPLNATIKCYINEMLDTIQPDLVVLGGDNTVGEAETKAEAIKEICDIFVSHETYFTLVFGNHDHQQMFDMETYETKAEQVDLIKEELFDMYLLYGGEYCLAYDADPELYGVGTHNLPIMSSDGSKVAFNIWMFDSNAYYPTEDADLGYDAVHEDEIQWYQNVAAELKEANDGEVVKSIAFQHIICEEVYDKLFFSTPFSCGAIGEDFEDGYYIYLPRVANIEDGFLFEKPCPGYKNYGQLDAMKETGDVLAIFTGHDHTNDFTVDVGGIKLTNSGGCTYNSYGNNLNRGCRVITIDEATSTYETYTYTLAKAALVEGSEITSYGDISEFEARFAVFWRGFMTEFVSLLRCMFFMFK